MMSKGIDPKRKVFRSSVHIKIGDGRSRSIDEGSGSVEFHVDPATKKLVKGHRSSKEREPIKEKCPEFIIKPRRQFIDEGQTARYKASFEGSPQTKLFWSKNGDVLAPDDKVKMYKDSEYHMLEIHGATSQDQGTYTCTIQNSAGSASASAELEIFVRPKPHDKKPGFLPPVVDLPLEDTEVAEGEKNVTLKCKFSNAIDATATWYKDGREISSWQAKTSFDGRTAKLVLREASKRNCGTYECAVKNSGGQVKTKASVFLLDPSVKPVPPKFVQSLSRHSAVDGDRVTLEAKVTGKPKPNITWYKDNVEMSSSTDISIESTEGTVRLVMDQATADDTAKYTCVAQNVAGKDQTEAKVEVERVGGSVSEDPREPPIFTKELHNMEVDDGDRLELSVEVKGTLPIDIIWVHNNREIPVNDPVCRMLNEETKFRLIIPEVFPEDAGEYVCEAYNDYGDTDTYCRIDVKEKDESTDTSESYDPPEFIIRPKSLHITDDKSAVFICRVSGYPDPDVLWKFCSQTLTTGNKYKLSKSGVEFTLEIVNPKPEDSGKYTCTAFNSEGEVTATANLIVRETIKSPAQTDFRSVLRQTRSPLREPFSPVERPERLGAETNKLNSPVTSPKPNSNRLVQMDFRGVLKPHQQTDFRNVLKPVKGDVKNLVKKFQRSISGDSESDTNADGDIKQVDFSRVLRSPTRSPTGSPTRSPTRSPLSDRLTSNEQESPLQNLELDEKKKLSRTSLVHKQQNGHSEAPIQETGSIGDIASDSKNKQKIASDSKNKTYSKNKQNTNESIDYRSVLNKHKEIDTKPSSQGRNKESDLDIDKLPSVLKHRLERKQNLEQYRTRIVSPLYDQAVQYGSPATLQCQLDGSPDPEIHWYVNNKEIKPSKYFKMSFEKNLARLVIAEAYSEDEGEYKVAAVNPAGTSSCSCELFVENPSTTSGNQSLGESVSDSEVPQDISSSLSPPKIYDLSPEKFSLIRGGNLEIQASFCAVPSPDIRWYKNKMHIKPDDRFQIRSSEHFSKLSLSNAQPEDSSRYHIVIENELGSDMASASLTVEDVPEPPVGSPSVSDLTKTSLTLSWYGPAYDGGCPVTSYRVEKCDAEEQDWEVLTTDCKHTTFQVVGLQQNTPYFFRVSAQNKHGFSKPCQTSEVVVTSDHEPHSLRLLSTESDDVFIDSPENIDSTPVTPITPVSALYPSPLSPDEIPFEHREVQITPQRVFDDHYSLQEEVGKGKFGSVYKCQEKGTDKTWAVKMIKCREVEKPKIRQEIEIMNQLKHPKILMLWDAFEASRRIILVMEFVAGGELFERVLDDDFELTERDCIQFMRQICDGVGYMHDKNILHLDLKPENILCIKNESNKIKIIDFGLARFHKKSESVRVLFGTPEFIAPEVVNYEEIGFETDMWSLGVICYVLLSGISPFMGDSDAETLSNVTLGEYDFEDDTFTDISANAKDFIEGLLVKNKKKRMTIKECMAHKWLAQDVEKLQRKKISTKNLKRFMARRKWQKTGNAIRALGRMTALQKGFRRDGTGGSIGDGVAGPGEGVTAPVYETGSQAVPPFEASEEKLCSATISDSFPKVKDNTESGDISKQNRPGGISQENNLPDVCKEDANDNNISKSRDRHHVTDSANHSETPNSALTKQNSPKRDCSNRSKTSVESNGFTSNDTNSSPAIPKSIKNQEQNNNKRKSSVTKRRQTSISGSLEFTKEMVDCKAFTGDVIRFDVAVSTKEPDLQITWYFEEEELVVSPRHAIQHGEHGECSLIIKKVSDEDDGEYSCIVRNGSGDEIVCSAELIVYGAI